MLYASLTKQQVTFLIQLTFEILFLVLYIHTYSYIYEIDVEVKQVKM